jgi:hypothetical protein
MVVFKVHNSGAARQARFLKFAASFPMFQKVMADRPAQSISSPADPPAEAVCVNVQQIAATNAAAALPHAGLVLRIHGLWAVQAEEPFREPPYWLFEPGE